MYDGITCLAENAFLGCSNLEKLIVPDSVISIGHLAFNTYHALEVYYTGTETQWNAITKDEELRFHFMYYPFTVYSGYDYNENWFVYTRIY